MEWFQLWLILHILAVIVGFGPTFVFALVGASIRREPQHALFGANLNHLIESRLVIPGLTLAPLFGAALIITRRYEFWESTWLLVAVPLFTVAWIIGIFINRPLSERIRTKLRDLTEGRAGPEAVAELQAMGKRAQALGVVMAVAMLAVLVLMVWRPGACFVGQVGC